MTLIFVGILAAVATVAWLAAVRRYRAARKLVSHEAPTRRVPRRERVSSPAKQPAPRTCWRCGCQVVVAEDFEGGAVCAECDL